MKLNGHKTGSLNIKVNESDDLVIETDNSLGEEMELVLDNDTLLSIVQMTERKGWCEVDITDWPEI